MISYFYWILWVDPFILFSMVHLKKLLTMKNLLGSSHCSCKTSRSLQHVYRALHTEPSLALQSHQNRDTACHGGSHACPSFSLEGKSLHLLLTAPILLLLAFHQTTTTLSNALANSSGIFCSSSFYKSPFICPLDSLYIPFEIGIKIVQYI